MAFDSIGGSEYAIDAPVTADLAAKYVNRDDHLKSAVSEEHSWDASDATKVGHNLYLSEDYWALGDF
jgi:hypothetical protein